MRTRTILVTGVAVLLAGAATVPARATDLDSLRTRAQRLGDGVGDLERRLENLQDKQAGLEAEIERASAEIGVLEMGVGEAEERYEAALDRYVDRAVEAYKSGPATDLALLLSTRSMDDFYRVLQANGISASSDREALSDLLATKKAAERVQQDIDERKQALLVRSAEVDEVASEIQSTLATRRSTLRELTKEIKALEREARAAAARSVNPGQTFMQLLQPSGPAPGIPDGFAGTGVSFQGIASWYGPGFEGNPTASGDIFDPDLFTAASRDLPLGTWLYVTYGGRGVVVLVNDRGPYIDDRVLDLSQAAAESLGISGLGWIKAEILIKK